MDVSDVALVLERRDPSLGSRHIFQKSRSLKVCARLALGIKVLRLELKIFISVCKLAD
jgi:hypothetical protein